MVPGRREAGPRAEIFARRSEIRRRRAELLARHEENLPRLLKASKEVAREPKASLPLDEYVGGELARIDARFRVARRAILADHSAKFNARRRQAPLNWWKDGPYPQWRVELEDERACRVRQAEADRLVAIRELEARVRLLKVEVGETAGDNPGRPSETQQDKTRAKGVFVRYPLVEKAVRLHEEKKYGRDRLQRHIPGLGDWGTRAVLYSYKQIGKPAGLWLDEDEHLRWGLAITPIWRAGAGAGTTAPAPTHLRLPRPRNSR